jgi:hypothetical protein
MIVGLSQVPFISACSSACLTGFDASNVQCNDSTYQLDFEKCINFTSPSNCTSLSQPVAHVNEDYYYINYYGKGNCFG